MPSESESDDHLLEQAYGYKVNRTYAEGCTLNKKRSIRRKAKKLVLVNGEVRLKKKTKGTNEVGKKLHSLISCLYSARKTLVELLEYSDRCRVGLLAHTCR